MSTPVTAMILAAGRGERMRPLTDRVPKPLLPVAGTPLIVRQIESLRRAGVRDVVINASHLAAQLVDAVGDGRASGVRIHWSIEPEPLETAGGIATALPHLGEGITLIVSADICTDYDYAPLVERAARMARDPDGPRVHLVMVPNPPYHPGGDFVLDATRGLLALEGAPRLTFGNIGLYDTALFAELPRGVKLKLLPLFEAWIAAGRVSGELYAGPWANVGTPDELARLDTLMRSRSARRPPTPTPA